MNSPNLLSMDAIGALYRIFGKYDSEIGLYTISLELVNDLMWIALLEKKLRVYHKVAFSILPNNFVIASFFLLRKL